MSALWAEPPRRRRRRPVGLVAVLAAVVMTMGVAWQAGASNSLPAPGWAVTATPSTGLLDGGAVAVNLKANDNVDILNVEIRQCRLGPTYATAADMSPRNGNCPNAPVSSSADQVLVKGASDGLLTNTKGPSGYTLNFHVGTGVIKWTAQSGPVTLTCDITTKCALVAMIQVGNDTVFKVFDIAFSDADPIIACGGTAPGVLHAAAADELADAWAQWTRAYCAANPGGAPSSTAFPGEGGAVTGFLNGGVVSGDLDVAYGNAGLDPVTGMLLPGTETRSTVAVPIALNAAVLGIGGGFHAAGLADKQSYPQLHMSAGDAAALLGGGLHWFQDDNLPYRRNVLSNNPQLDGIAYGSDPSIIASSLPLSSVWYTTKFFKNVVPQDWVYRQATDAPVPRGAAPSLAGANPPFTDTRTLTGRPAMAKVALTAALDTVDGPLWVFTDRATAASLKLAPVALEDATGTFVAPDNATMTAAVDKMKPNVLGLLQPDLSAVNAADGLGTAVVEPYPLTYVEYAFVPTEQLVDPTTCQARTASEALLTNWLQYITTSGQTNLAPGLEPLPDSLKTQAVDAIAKVGTAPTTGPCAGRVTSESVSGAAGPGTAPTGSPSSFPTANIAKPATAAPAATATNVADANAAKKKNIAVAVPAFAGHTLADPLGGVVALLGIVLLMSLAAWITAGGSLSGGGQFTPGSLGSLTGKRIGSLALLWGGVGLACLGLVLFQLGPLLEQRDQKSLLASYRTEVKNAAARASPGSGLQSTSDTPAPAPNRGAAVGILEIGALKSQDVVIEGVEASQTRSGPGHVPGTAGLGQPGNAVVVARRNGYGGSFAGAGALVKGDRIVVTTTQGPSVYAVSKVCEQSVTADSGDSGSSSRSVSPALVPTEPCTAPKPASAGRSTTAAAADPTATTTTVAGAATTAPSTTTTASGAAGSQTSVPAAATKASGSASYAKATVAALPVDKLYGPSKDDRLTLVTSGEKTPWNSSRATIVVAKLLSKPFAPTTQGTRADGETGFGGDSGAWPAVVLALLAFVGVIVGSVALYRRMRFRVAYVLTIAPLVALTLVVGEQLARLLPAWT